MKCYVGVLDGRPGAFGVVVPDFGAAVHGGGPTFDAAVQDATSCLADVVGMMQRDGEQLPEPRSLEVVLAEYDATIGGRERVAVVVTLPDIEG